MHLSDLMAQLGVEDFDLKMVKNVSFDDESLVKVKKDGDDWTLTSLKAFKTEQKLTVEMVDGSKIEVKVTDASEVNLGDYLTGFTAYKKNGDKWVPATTFTDGEDATFSLNFTVPSGSLTDGQKTLTYSLGENVVLPDKAQSGNVTQNGKTVGTYSITKDGKITITLNDDYDTHTAFKGNITFEGTVKNTGGQNGSTVNFGTDEVV